MNQAYKAKCICKKLAHSHSGLAGAFQSQIP